MFRYAKNVRLASFLLHWLSPCLFLGLYGSQWLPLWLPLAPAGSNLLSQAFTGSLALTGSLPVSLCLSMALCDSHSGSYWLSLPLSGILWPSLAHYCSLISLTQSLISSQRRCHADTLYPGLPLMYLFVAKLKPSKFSNVFILLRFFWQSPKYPTWVNFLSRHLNFFPLDGKFLRL